MNREFKISVSQEYIDALCTHMDEWSQKDNSLTIGQFQKAHGISFFYLKACGNVSEKVKKSFDLMKAVMHTRWLDMALDKDNLPPHMSKVLMRYLRLYDDYGLDIELQSRKEVASAGAPRSISIEDYAKEQIDDRF